ncbi:MAG: transposase, partial [Planctomycetes bacterium]|nr:transposase [Planctomycetota bacterium]
VEPVFGVVKHVLGFRRFMMRGLSKVGAEWELVCLAYNFLRLHRLKMG